MLTNQIKQINVSVSENTLEMQHTDNPHDAMYLQGIVDVLESVALKTKEVLNHNITIAAKENYAQDYYAGILEGLDLAREAFVIEEVSSSLLANYILRIEVTAAKSVFDPAPQHILFSAPKHLTASKLKAWIQESDMSGLAHKLGKDKNEISDFDLTILNELTDE